MKLIKTKLRGVESVKVDCGSFQYVYKDGEEWVKLDGKMFPCHSFSFHATSEEHGPPMICVNFYPDVIEAYGEK
jgi:carbonic anhydrase